MGAVLNSARRKRCLDGSAATSQAAAPSPLVSIVGNNVKLITVDPYSQAEVLFDLTHNCEGADALWDYMFYGPFKDAGEMGKWMEDCASTTDPLFYCLTNATTGLPFGMASYLNIEPSFGSIEIGNIWIAPQRQRTILATEAIYLMMAHALDSLKYRRLEWKCDALNGKSRSAARRFGFSFEGIFYKHMIVKGKNRDTAWFSITDDEWPALRANFKTWLAADNFDAAGQQKSRLSELNWDQSHGPNHRRPGN